MFLVLKIDHYLSLLLLISLLLMLSFFFYIFIIAIIIIWLLYHHYHHHHHNHYHYYYHFIIILAIIILAWRICFLPHNQSSTFFVILKHFSFHAWKFLLQFGPTLFGTVRSLVPNKDKFKMAT